MVKKESAGKAVRDVRRKARRRFSAEEKIRIVIEGSRGEESIAPLYRREGIVANPGEGVPKDSTFRPYSDLDPKRTLNYLSPYETHSVT